MERCIQLDGVSKAFGSTLAVDDLALEVPRGSIYGFIGPNGSGKTTTLRMIMNILRPDTGSISVFGERLRDSCTDRIGYLPEERGLYKDMRVREVIKFYGQLKNGKDLDRRIDAWIERLDMGEWQGKKVKELSKGMSQKVQFVAAVVTDPELVILDEPFAGLDPINAETIRQSILELQRSGTTVILSTHDMHVAETMCNFVFMIFRGRKVLDGALGAIREEYGTDTVRLRTEGGAAVVRDLPGVACVRDYGREQELQLGPEADPRELLLIIANRTAVTRFEITTPSLSEIFFRVAGAEARDDEGAQTTSHRQAGIPGRS